MYRIDNSTAATSLPTPGAATGVDGYFTLGNPAGGIPATIVDQDWANAVQEELCNAITGAGVTLSKTSRNQLSTAIGDRIAVETSRAEAAEALKAPIAGPAFTGNGSIVGSFTAGSYSTAGTASAGLLETTGTGSASIGSGGITTSGNITASAGTVTAVDLAFTGELSGPSFSVVGGNVSATSGTVTAVDLTATNTLTAPIISLGNELISTGSYLPILSQAYTAILNGNGSAYNPLYCGLSLATQAAVIMNSCSGYLTGNGYTRIPSNQVSTGYMIVQWGQCNTGYGIGVALPIAFPNAFFGCTISEAAASNATWGGGDVPTLHAATVQSTNSFVHWTLSWNGSGWVNASNTGFFVAWGY